MIPNAHKQGLITQKQDVRITAIGKVLRKYKLDELPQLFNVLKGDMSFVGPRPEVEKFAKMFKNDYEIILQVRPGITDYASITYRNEDSYFTRSLESEKVYVDEILPHKIKTNKEYVTKNSFLKDINIIILTLLRIM